MTALDCYYFDRGNNNLVINLWSFLAVFLNIDKQFHHHFTSSFCADILWSKNFKAKM